MKYKNLSFLRWNLKLILKRSLWNFFQDFKFSFWFSFTINQTNMKLYIHSFLQQIFLDYLLCTSTLPGCEDIAGNKTGTHCHMDYDLVVEKYNHTVKGLKWSSTRKHLEKRGGEGLHGSTMGEEFLSLFSFTLSFSPYFIPFNPHLSPSIY